MLNKDIIKTKSQNSISLRAEKLSLFDKFKPNYTLFMIVNIFLILWSLIYGIAYSNKLIHSLLCVGVILLSFFLYSICNNSEKVRKDTNIKIIIIWSLNLIVNIVFSFF